MPPSVETITTFFAVARSSTIAGVILLQNIDALLDKQPLDFAAFGPGLVRDEGHAKYILRKFADILRRAGNFDAAALAAASCMDLRLYDRNFRRQFTRRLDRLFDLYAT